MTETFRCPVSHVARVNHLVPDYRAHASNPIGVVRDEVDLADLLAWSRPGDMILCRNNAPLVGACLRLIARNVPAVIRGRDVGAELIDLVESWEPTDLDDLRRRLKIWGRKQREKLADLEEAAAALDHIADVEAALSVVADSSRSVPDLVAKLRSLFGDQLAGKVVLSSVHRAKGLEADRVAIIVPELLGGGRATSDEARQQERNLEYVAGTRSKMVLEFESQPKGNG